jgi:hypothetical protein
MVTLRYIRVKNKAEESGPELKPDTQFPIQPWVWYLMSPGPDFLTGKMGLKCLP